MDDNKAREEEVRPDPGDPEKDHPAQEAHGGSMAPGMVDDTGEQVTDGPPAGDER
ncbi:GTPase activator [Actinoplanes sp. NPDC049548]|uniref:GTPase activator n=1 Tax=Actinoplanes sp. NPDC049548 TaxID=3155152 RepID=UPI003444287E